MNVIFSRNVATLLVWICLIERSIERSLSRLRTDHLDLLLLHSCSLENLRRGEVISSLQRARVAGKVRFIGFSGDRSAARFAAICGAFDAIEISVSIADQEATDQLIPLATANKLGVIAKRSLANLAWQRRNLPSDVFLRNYRKRLQILDYAFLRNKSSDATSIALRFTTRSPCCFDWDHKF